MEELGSRYAGEAKSQGQYVHLTCCLCPWSEQERAGSMHSTMHHIAHVRNEHEGNHCASAPFRWHPKLKATCLRYPRSFAGRESQLLAHAFLASRLRQRLCRFLCEATKKMVRRSIKLLRPITIESEIKTPTPETSSVTIQIDVSFAIVASVARRTIKALFEAENRCV